MEAQPAALKRAAGGQAFAAGKGVQGLAQSVWFNGLLQPAGSSWRQALVGGLQSEMQNLQVLHLPDRGAGLVTHLWVACSVGWPLSGQRLCIRGRESQRQGALIGASSLRSRTCWGWTHLVRCLLWLCSRILGGARQGQGPCIQGCGSQRQGCAGKGLAWGPCGPRCRTCRWIWDSVEIRGVMLQHLQTLALTMAVLCSRAGSHAHAHGLATRRRWHQALIGASSSDCCTPACPAHTSMQTTIVPSSSIPTSGYTSK